MNYFRHKGTDQEIGLLELIEKTNGGIMTEVGSAYGESAVLFAQKFSKVYCIDKWDNQSEDREKYFDDYTKNYPQVIKLKGYSKDRINDFEDSSLDLVYIDATHTYNDLKQDIELWLPKIKSGGFIGGHDYSFKFLGVIQAVTETIIRPDYVFRDSSWLKQIK